MPTVRTEAEQVRSNVAAYDSETLFRNISLLKKH